MKEQALVNAQIEVNRAVHLMNVRHNRQFYPDYSDEDLSDEKIMAHVRAAIKDLNEAGG